MCRGLPASGKSTWARQQVEACGGEVVSVSKDAIRLHFFGDRFQIGNETAVILERDRQIIHALNAGKSVISEDTNLSPDHQRQLRIIARRFRATFQIKNFETSVDECIRRDSLREGGACVGEAAIRRMAAGR